MKFKKINLVFVLLTLCNLHASAQSASPKVEFGFSVNQFHQDFGLGFHVISPYFLYDKVAVKAGANFQWFEYFNGTETTWSPYQNYQLGIRARNSVIENKLYIYGEGGVLTIFPGSDFSTNNFEFGGYGIFGFEFKPSSKFAYYIELGGVGTGAKANKLITKPIFSNGFITSVGFNIGI